MNTLQSEWESFKHKVIPPDAPGVQLTESQKAFYAGAAAYAHIAMKATLMSHQAAGSVLIGINQELDDFVASLSAEEDS